MERLKNMKETLMSCVQSQIGGHLSEVDSKELGEAIDMIKDLSEAIYYCTITESMEEGSKYNKGQQREREVMYYPIYMRDMDRMDGRMYYNGGSNGNSSSSSGSNSPSGNSGSAYYGGYKPMEGYNQPQEFYPREMMHDYREGRSPMARRTYMEGKELHKGKEAQMKELEKYMQELSHDITEMIEDATPEEKQVLKQKVAMLANKIQ